MNKKPINLAKVNPPVAGGKPSLMTQLMLHRYAKTITAADGKPVVVMDMDDRVPATGLDLRDPAQRLLPPDVAAAIDAEHEERINAAQAKRERKAKAHAARAEKAVQRGAGAR